MGLFNVTSQKGLIALLFDVGGESAELRELMAAPSCAHHLSPQLSGISATWGLVQRIYASASPEAARQGLRMDAAYFRTNTARAAEGITLEAVLQIYMMLAIALDERSARADPRHAETRLMLIDLLGFTGLGPGLVHPSTHYFEMSIRTPRAGDLVPVPALLERMDFAADDFTGLARAAHPSDPAKALAAAQIFRALATGYPGREGSTGSYKVTGPTAHFLYETLADAAHARDVLIEGPAEVYSSAHRKGRRSGQATRSLPVSSGNMLPAAAPELAMAS